MSKILFSILIPCLNEEKTIRNVIRDVKKSARKYFNNKFEILVADNGSTDKTLSILSKIRGIRIINVPVKGYGAALHWGMIKSRGEYIIFADADLSYPFSNLKKFKSKIKEKPDLVLGSRLRGKIEKGAMPPLHRYFGTPLLTILIRTIYGISTTDCNSGMRMVKKSFYKKLNMRCSGMEWASELLLKTAINNGKYLEIPITFHKDKRDKPPNLNTWADGWRHLKSIFLLKPKSLLLFLGGFIVAGLFFSNRSFALTFLFFDLSVVLTLSLFTLALLESVINHKPNRISEFLSKFTLVPLTLLLALIVGLSVIFIPDFHLGTKLFLVSLLSIIFMWIFMIETIKTHLVNRLPDIKK